MSNLNDLGAQMYADSAYWFPTVHDRGQKAISQHYAMGLAGETGEVLDVVKKADICGYTDTCDLHADGKHSKAALASEIADVLTYLLALAHIEGVDVEAAYAAKRQVNAERWGLPS